MDLLKRIKQGQAELSNMYVGGLPSDDPKLIRKSQELDKLILTEQKSRLNKLKKLAG